MASRTLRLALILWLVCLAAGLAGAPAAAAEPEATVDDFETPLRSGFDGNGVPIGFFIAQDNNSTTAFSRTDSPPAAVPDAPTPNNVLKMDFNVSSFGVVIHGFENDAVNTWVTQDWSAYAGFA